MVFSFFKKSPEKMVARPAIVPRPKKSQEAVLPTIDNPDPTCAPQPGTTSLGLAKDSSASPDFSDFVFSESSPDFQIEVDIDPIDAEAEEAAVLYANAQNETARAVLENAVHTHRFGPGERLWLMLFDLYRLTGDKAAFEALEIDFAQAFEKSPPGWHNKSNKQPKTETTAVDTLLFPGSLTGDNAAAFNAIRHALEQAPKLRIDLSKINALNAEGCDRLLALLQTSRKSKQEIELLGRDILAALLESCVESKLAKNKECWLLLLEIYQLQGKYEIFEDVAISYAVTFEVSPPSWEVNRVAAPEPILQLKTENADEVLADAYVMRGDIKASRFGDLPAYADTRDTVLIDCNALSRIDFISAGALLNVLSSIRRTGKQIVLHHPNYLVAELLGVVGLNAVATIVFSKH